MCASDTWLNHTHSTATDYSLIWATKVFSSHFHVNTTLLLHSCCATFLPMCKSLHQKKRYLLIDLIQCICVKRKINYINTFFLPKLIAWEDFFPPLTIFLKLLYISVVFVFAGCLFLSKWNFGASLWTGCLRGCWMTHITIALFFLDLQALMTLQFGVFLWVFE